MYKKWTVPHPTDRRVPHECLGFSEYPAHHGTRHARHIRRDAGYLSADSRSERFPVCPACAFVLRCELVVLLAVGNAVRGHKFDVHLNLLSGVFGSLVGLVLPAPALLFRPDRLVHRSLEAAVAPAVSICTSFLVAQKKIPSVALCIPQNLRQLFLRLLARHVVRCTALIFQAFYRPVVPLFPLVHRLSAAPVPICRIRHAFFLGMR